ncbi:hypothetical protein E0H77_03390 [Acinetobacter sp. ANC 4633]|uniref:hypothetical protein n=1 Tax=Acinetobacter sp. ANC 4633 TaxID=2529845 RepID=UPI001040D88E|nr:hypothetical protein [Acinetobacter sp. ANC 4633]TCB27742.1 hypothetical protein E0H77_03390 [Acinetobacter sp. ANC 4633]
MNNQVNLVSQKQKVRHQQGFASLLFVLLIGLSLVIIVLGVFITLRGLQDSAITSHAQTQAEERSTIGVKALSNFLYSKTDTQISSITSGTITDKNGTLTGTANSTVATYVKSATCPTGAVTQYCFDVTASSGGASATIRTVYQKASIVGSTTLTGSVFAGGLVVGGNATFTGDVGNPISIAVGGTSAGQICTSNNCSSSYTAAQLLALGLTVTTYQSMTYISASDLKEYANYQFTSSGCYKLNFYTSTGTVMSKTSITCPITPNTDGTWSITDPASLPIGVLWFDNNLTIQLVLDSTLVNTIITTGTLTVNAPQVTGNTTKTVNNYAPYWYYSSATGSTSDGRVCGAYANTGVTTIPSQYCNYSTTSPTFNTSSLTGAGGIANILFLTNSTLTLDAGNSSKLILNYYGNLIASNGAGGTGNASGKFTGSGSINITGNLVMAGTTDTTTMTGNIKLDLSQSTAANSSVIPTVTYANGLRFIKYM